MYPEESIQYLVDPWWVKDDTGIICRGRLLDAFVPHTSQNPTAFILEGRASSTDHEHFEFRTEPLTINTRAKKATFPVASMPLFPKELHTIYKGKVRRVLVISELNPPVPTRMGSAPHQTAPTILVAPYYGVDANGGRGGWPAELVRRTRLCEYPQYMWDMLPDSLTGESILRLDHVQPLLRASICYRVLPHRLSNDALEVLADWEEWYRTGRMNADGILAMVRQDWMKKEIGFLAQIDAE